MENVVKYIHFKTDKPNIVDESLIAFHKVQQSLSRLMTFGVDILSYGIFFESHSSIAIVWMGSGVLIFRIFI